MAGEIPALFHVHIYYDPAATKDKAAALRARIAEKFPAAKVGRWHDELVGPHLRSMYQVAFARALFDSFVPWLMLNRDGLAILLHPETGDAYTDHSAHAVWYGEVLPLNLEVLR